VIRYSSRVLAASVAFFLAISPAAIAETIKGALAKAYANNSELNSARAGVRVTDEGVAIAKSGYRPTVTGEGSLSYSSSALSRNTTAAVGITINQTLFDGFQTKNNVAAAKSQVFAQRENLRNTEQNILLNAASAYMDVIRDRQIAVLRKKNLAALQEQVRAASARFEVGEGTRTDVAQANATRAAAIAALNAAEAQAKSSAAVYRQIIGDEPGKLQAAGALTKLMPKSLDQAFAAGAGEHISLTQLSLA
jgi:outer membrane protein